MKKLRREYLKAERNVSTALDPETKLFVKLTALFKALQVVPNLKSLESLLFTAFVEFDVKKAVWPLLDTKSFPDVSTCIERTWQQLDWPGAHFALSDHGLRARLRGLRLRPAAQIRILGQHVEQSWGAAFHCAQGDTSVRAQTLSECFDHARDHR